MSNDNAITRLLYAILSQKCLKDIDWTKVAHDPILCQEITNGHAARMRYSRFKKQMDGTSVRNPRKPTGPKKSKVEKSKTKAVKNIEPETKSEPVDRPDELCKPKIERGQGSMPATMGFAMHQELQQMPAMVKPEPSESSQYPLGPLSDSISPSSSPPFPTRAFSPYNKMTGMHDMRDSMYGHEMHHEPHGGHYQQPLMGGEMDRNIMHGYHPGVMHDPFHGMWIPQGGHEMGSHQGVVVKTEPRWEEAYRQT